MNQKDYDILKQFAEKVRKQFPDARIWAFGSRARGLSSEYSDLDVCIALNNLDEAIDKMIINIAWEIGFNNDIVISTVSYSNYDFDNGPLTFSTFIKSILKNGIAA